MTQEKREEKREIELIDLDALSKRKRIVKVAGKSLDVSVIPARTSLQIAQYGDDEPTMTQVEKIRRTAGLISTICGVMDDDVTEDWLLDHLSVEGLMDLVQFIIKPIEERRAERGNAAAVQSE